MLNLHPQKKEVIGNDYVGGGLWIAMMDRGIRENVVDQSGSSPTSNSVLKDCFFVKIVMTPYRRSNVAITVGLLFRVNKKRMAITLGGANSKSVPITTA